MLRFFDLLQKWLPERFKTRRYMLDSYQFDLTSFRGDVTDWLNKFPISDSNSEVYFALAELFRRRGEFDKAVTVHQAIAAAELTTYSSSEIELEVAQDYYAAGLLGHAEEVLIKALEDADDHVSRQAFRLWLAILESEQDWHGAVQLVERYGVSGSGGLRLVNLYCEYAKDQLQEDQIADAHKTLRKARKLQRGSRSELMLAELATQQNKIVDAVNHYKDLLERDPKRVELVLSPLKQLSLMYGNGSYLLSFLERLYKRHPSIRILEAILEIYEKDGVDIPEQWREQFELQVKTGLSYKIVEHWLTVNNVLNEENLVMLKPALQQASLIQNDIYRCTSCGFNSDQMVWRCPQCKSWETVYSDYELKIAADVNKSA